LGAIPFGLVFVCPLGEFSFFLKKTPQVLSSLHFGASPVGLVSPLGGRNELSPVRVAHCQTHDARLPRKKKKKEKMRVEDYLFPRYPGICAATLVDSIYIDRSISMYSKIKEAWTVGLLRV